MTTALSLAPDTASVAPIHDRVAALLAKRLFFIVGCQKSGTTWVQRLLDGHDAVRCHGEAYLAPVLLPVLKQALELYNGKQKAGDIGRFNNEQLRALFATAVALIFDRWVEGAPVQCVGEKTPEHALCLPTLLEVFPAMRVIHVIRDGRDVAVSGWFHNLRQNEARFRARFADMPAYIKYLVQAHWVPYIRAAQAFGQLHAEQYLELRYEQLIDDPHEQTARMLAFLGVDESERSVSRCVEAGAFQALSTGRRPGQEDRGSFFRKGVAGDWRQHFDQRCVDAFEEHGGSMLRELGYVEEATKRRSDGATKEGEVGGKGA